jgi:hypothetical protein
VLDLAKCTLRGNGSNGVNVKDCNSRVTATGCHEIGGNTWHGAVVVKGGSLVLWDCRLDGNGCTGITVEGPGSSAKVTECQASKNGWAGAKCLDGACWISSGAV